MSKDTVTVWWIEEDTGDLRSQPMGSHDICGGRTFEYEVLTKYARQPIDITVIHNQTAGNDWERSEMERLRVKSAQLREAIASAKT